MTGTEQQPIRTRRAMACFWWQHERDEQLRSGDVLAARRTGSAGTTANRLIDEEPARPLPAAG